MIHLIYIYFIVNSFLAGLFHKDLENKYYTICWLLFGCLYPLLLFITWIDNKVELSTIFMIYFTDYFKVNKDRISSDFKWYYNDTDSRYKKFILRKIDKKYNYGITDKNN